MTAQADSRYHIALHLAHRWFAFFEAPGGDLKAHLAMFHPQVQLSGHRGRHVFATDHRTLANWFSAIPDAVSSHHIIHSTFAATPEGDGLLCMVVAYQAPSDDGMHGSIISYETRIEFAPGIARFTALDKTPILPNTRSAYDTSWSSNRVLALVHAELGGLGQPDSALRAALGPDVGGVTAVVTAREGQSSYKARVIATSGDLLTIRTLWLDIEDDSSTPLPKATLISASQDPAV